MFSEHFLAHNLALSLDESLLLGGVTTSDGYEYKAKYSLIIAK